MNTYDSTNDVKAQLKAQLQVTHQWACSRSFGNIYFQLFSLNLIFIHLYRIRNKNSLG
jgi:hypothetical protein